MKLVLILGACVLLASATPVEKTEELLFKSFNELAPNSTHHPHTEKPQSQNERNLIINMLIRQLFVIIRSIINNGSILFGIPPLDPLTIDNLSLNVPAGLINFEVALTNGLFAGIGRFVVHRSNLNIRDLTFDIDISVPTINIAADNYKVVGDIYTAIPFYGDGSTNLVIENFRFQATLHLKQSDDGKSVLIEKITDTAFNIGGIKADITGVIGGGSDMDAVANIVVEEIVLDYINRLNKAIGLVAAEAVVYFINPILDQLDTWRYIDLIL